MERENNILNEFIQEGMEELDTENDFFIELDDEVEVYAKPKKRTVPKWTTSIRVPEEAHELLTEIDYKMAKLKRKFYNKGDKWYYGLLVLNKLLDHINPDDLERDQDIIDYILELIDTRL